MTHERLIKLLGMLGSAFAGERANAGQMVDAYLKQHKLNWQQLINGTSYTKPDYRKEEQAYDRGYKIGKEAGRQEGYRDGLAEGKRRATPPPPPAPHIANEQHRELCARANQYFHMLTAWEKGFIRSVSNVLEEGFNLSEKQALRLKEINEKLKGL